MKMRHWLIGLAVLLMLLIAAVPAGAEPRQELAPGEILVQFKSGAAASDVAEAHRKHGGQEEEVISGLDVRVVRVPHGQEAARAAEYQKSPNVVYAEVNSVYHTDALPNDSLFNNQWQYNNATDADIDAVEAWNKVSGNPGVAIAILDTGIDQSHEDLAGKVTKSVNFSSSPTLDDKFGHGTHVAGSAAARTNNTTGVAGTCPNCTLYNVKVLDDTGNGSSRAIARGIAWAADNGARVINLSLGSATGNSTVQSAVNYAWNRGVVVVAAAGNDGSSALHYPAAYTNVIAVGATTNADAKASFSNYGANWVDVAAPGMSIYSTQPDHADGIWGASTEKYGTMNGTSMATPHVAGVAGLVWSTNPGAPAAWVRAQIESKTDPVGLSDWQYGRVNACKAVGGVCTN